ncbi:hypothetical protein ACHAWU_004246 [Discostella pseudostelligera]|uniref:Uncharacterized protein n=1 Tax=Discostella pseudostelligera TaxID=259834 RepID=A0ABD3MAZ5_9STRA
MMISCNDDADEEIMGFEDECCTSRPIMIEVDHGEEEVVEGMMTTTPTTTRHRRRGKTTIPSVVAFVPKIDGNDEQQPPPLQPPLLDNDADRSRHLQNNLELSLPPMWATMARTTSAATTTLQPLSSDTSNYSPMNNHYQIHVGKAAILYENQFPNSTYRNVKRVIGTGGTVAKMAFGVVPNLFVNDDNQNNIDGIDDFLLMPRRNIIKKKSKKMKRKKEAEGLPKLHKQLEEARTIPALLSCDILNGAVASDSPVPPSSTSGEEMLLCPEQISACILRKLYNAAELYWYDRNQSHGKNTVVKVTLGGGVSEVLATSGDNRLGGTDFDERVAEYLCMCAVDYGRSQGSSLKKSKNKSNTSNKDKKEVGKVSFDGFVANESDAENAGGEREKRRVPIIKDWYRHGSGDVPSIILRVAEKVRIRLSNQKSVEVLVPLTEDGWRKIGGGGGNGDDEALSQSSMRLDEDTDVIIGPLFDKMRLETERGMVEGIDYIIVTLDRKIFESICSSELQRLLRPLREVAIMARVLLPGEARPSFVENAKAMMMDMRDDTGYIDDEDDLWEFDGYLTTVDDDDFEKKDVATVLDEQALQQIQAMDIKSQKKAQQRGRKLSRDIDKRERSFRKQKQTAMEDATTASLLGRQLGGGGASRMKRGVVGGKAAATLSQQSTSVGLLGNERVQEGIHGRPLSKIILVGGATRMPVISKLLEAVVGMVPQRTVNPDEAVALGCAVQVGILDGVNDGLLGGVQAVLSPMQAAVMRALAKKNVESMRGDGMDARTMMEGRAGSLMVVDEFDDEDDFS